MELPCGCGRIVTVPSLARLKASVGEAALSPDLELTYLVQTRSLPVEAACVCCGRTTDHTIAFDIVCESVTVEDGQMPFWQKLLVLVLFQLLVFRWKTERSGVFGRDVRFRLPCRVCEVCARDVAGKAASQDVLARTPVYARLLTKYPHAQVSRVI